jgi:hypothetical protein
MLNDYGIDPHGPLPEDADTTSVNVPSISCPVELEECEML